METTSLDDRQSEISCVKCKSQGAMAKHFMIARDSMVNKLTSRKILLTWGDLGKWAGGEKM